MTHDIGLAGEQLTLAVRVINLDSLFIFLDECKRYIPHFKGIFIFYLNHRLSKKCRDHIITKINPNALVKLYDQKSSYLEYQWRNAIIDDISTPWVMFLDTNISIHSNFLPKLYGEVYQSKAKFISITLSCSEKMCISDESRQLHLFQWQKPNEPIKNSLIEPPFFVAGISLIHVTTLKQEGAFDQSLYLGYEECKLAIDFIKKGHHVYSSESLSFKIRSTKVLHSTIRNDKKHHPICLPNPLRQKKYVTPLMLNGTMFQQTNATNIRSVSKKYPPVIRVAIIIDVVNWAFANIALNLLKLKQDIIEFIVIPIYDPLSFNGDIHLISAMLTHCDIIHFMWRGELVNFCFQHHPMKLPSLPVSLYHDLLLNNKIISTAIYDHGFLPYNYPDYKRVFINLIKSNYYTVNRDLFDLYSAMPEIAPPKMICTDGVDLTLFRPKLARHNTRREIHIGWAGNSEWGQDDHKGLFTIITPTVERLIHEGYPILFKIADRKKIWREQYDMLEFYNELDIYICASRHEGTPNTVLEAMACGLAIVSTDVGIVREAFGSLQKEYIIERSANELYTKLKILLDHPERLISLREENLVSIKAWCWEKKAKELLNYFIQLANEKKLLSNEKDDIVQLTN